MIRVMGVERASSHCGVTVGCRVKARATVRIRKTSLFDRIKVRVRTEFCSKWHSGGEIGRYGTGVGRYGNCLYWTLVWV